MCPRPLENQLFALLCAFTIGTSNAQPPDTLYYTLGDTDYSKAVSYDQPENSTDYLLEGRFTEDPTKIAVLMPYKRGKPSGLFRAFYPDGSLLIRAVYGWGSLHGDWTEYDEDGIITVKGQYRDGLRDGKWVFRREGIRGKYKNGLKHGKWKYYNGKTITRVEKYYKGKVKTGGTFRFNNR